MNATELEKFYTIGNVEGLAFVDLNHILIENQMMVSQEVATALAQSFSSIFGNLAAAQRPCKAFLVRTTKFQFLGISTNSGIVILQLNPGEEVNTYFREAVSIIGTLASSDTTTAPAPASIAQPTIPGEQSISSQEPQATGSAADDISAIYEDFSTQVLKALTKVAPSHIARKLLKSSAHFVLQGAASPSSTDQIIAIGQNVVASVPNAGRRKLLETEFQLIIEQLGLTP